MTVTAVRKDPHTLTLTLEAEFDASPERLIEYHMTGPSLRRGQIDAILAEDAVSVATARGDAS